ncbi:MAG: hypothetical protein PHX79_06385 [Sphaerochaetaceae bacterium]|nr:hypothetical protein [Sphaerochaetaceae bacterium]
MVGKKKLCIFILILLMTLSSLIATENPIVTMDLLPTLTYKAHSDSWGAFFNGDLSVALSSKREGNVRGEVVLKATTLTSITSLNDVLYKAYFRARFPSFRLTAGKTRLSWGDGMLFNAGDVLYGSNSTSVFLTKAELRSTTNWLASVNYPLGFFSFAEAVVMPSETNNPADILFGARYYTTVKDIKVEIGYATKTPKITTTRQHKPYLSLQGNLGFDWYLSSSLAIPEDGDIAKESSESWIISGGFFHLVTLPQERSLSLRLEFLTRPFGSWEIGPVSDDSAALLLYPELVLAYSPSLSFTLRSIISPLDLSAMSTIGVSWNVFEAFNLIGSLSLATGDDGDLFAWSSTDTPASFSATVGSSWVF